PGEATTGIVLVLHDVTELRRLERTRRDFVANASHELKTPLSSIKAYTETLLDWGLEDPDVNVRFLTRINEQADRLHQLILDMLSLARLDSGDSGWERRPLAVVPAVEGYVESHRARAESKGLTIVFRTTSISRSDAIMGDEEALRQIVDNLIDNAIKYTPEGGRVEVGCRLAADEIRIEVSDTGIGIPRDELPRVFERFYRVDKARSRELGGTGLGLSIVKHLTQALEGRVEVESRLGRGSTFTVYLPRPAVAEAGVAAARPAAAHA
ncbi:MAG: PAS domain-containing sensor histidine kinase, partial [Planctomycetota bacterium]|nr:PAS domain-containing sensor histidine kinase [Planctomycetota bacterium]